MRLPTGKGGAGADPASARTMRGAVLVGPERIDVRELPVPRAGPGELVLAVRAATTCGTDVKVYRRGGHPRMLATPTLFGHEMAGVVAEVGEGVRDFAPGDAVMVANSASCGECDYCAAGRENLCRRLVYLNGAFAEYLLVPAAFVARSTHRLARGLAFERAALAEPLACVLHGLHACGLGGSEQAREVVVYGAGPIGLMFTAVLARRGHRVLLADPNPSRLAVGELLGAGEALVIARGGGEAPAVRARTARAEGAALAVDCTGVPAVWRDTVETVRAGGEALLFGGCAPGTTVALDTNHVHYAEITVRGAYHHRPASVRAALALLADPAFAAERLLSGERPIDEVAQALDDMIAKRALKVVIRGRR